MRLVRSPFPDAGAASAPLHGDTKSAALSDGPYGRHLILDRDGSQNYHWVTGAKLKRRFSRFGERRNLTLKANLSRRELVQVIATAGLASSRAPAAAPPRSRAEGPDTPKLRMNLSVGDINEASMRRVKQIGVNHVYMANSPIPWQEAQIRSMMEGLKQGGLTLGNMMIPWITSSGTASGSFPRAIYGKA